jgi:hypothetical protein
MKLSKKKPLKKPNKRNLNHLLSTITPSRVLWWKVSGLFYGYPQCCIEAFCRLDHIREESATGDSLCAQVGNSTGFVPCRTCAEKIRDGQTTLKELVQERKCPRPFPRCNNDDKDLIYDMLGM